MGNQKITLAIFGNQNSNSGFQPLYWINNPPRQLENLVPPGMEENACFFVLETTPAFTQYTLIQNHVSSFMAVRPGVLKIGITIPAGYKIAGGVSPMDVLLRIRDTFLAECMTLKSQFSDTYNFKEALAGEQVFSQIVNDYTLTPAPYPRQRVMQGTDDAVLLLPAEQIALLFKCPQYAEFESCAKVIVAEKGNTDVYQKVLGELQIPFQSALKLKVNNTPAEWKVVDYFTEETVIDLDLDKEQWSYPVVRFKVDDLPLENATQGYQVYIDPLTETVFCNIVPKKIEVRKPIEAIPKSDSQPMPVATDQQHITESPRSTELPHQMAPRSQKSGISFADIFKLVIMPLASFCIGMLLVWCISLLFHKDEPEAQQPEDTSVGTSALEDIPADNKVIIPRSWLPRESSPTEQDEIPAEAGEPEKQTESDT